MSEPELRAYQEAFLLLQILGEPERRILKGAANKALTNASNRNLGLIKAAPANRLRAELVDSGWITTNRVKTEKGGTTTEFVLTDAGLERLLELPQYPGELRIPGRAIDRMRRALLQRDEVDQPGSATENLSEVVLEIVESLHRERHSRSGLVPIHEIRAEIHRRLPAFADHEQLDPVLKELWQQGRFGLVPISDKSTASDEELEASIPGIGQTLFYAEPRS